MKNTLVRFGLAVDGALLEEFDALVAARGCSRSELFRDLARAEVSRARTAQGGDAIATLTVVYDHHVRELTERLTELQHELGAAVCCTLHVHLTHDDCLEVIVMRGRADELRAVADRIAATRGVKHGRVEIIAHESGAAPRSHAHENHVGPPRNAHSTHSRNFSVHEHSVTSMKQARGGPKSVSRAEGKGKPRRPKRGR